MPGSTAGRHIDEGIEQDALTAEIGTSSQGLAVVGGSKDWDFVARDGASGVT